MTDYEKEYRDFLKGIDGQVPDTSESRAIFMCGMLSGVKLLHQRLEAREALQSELIKIFLEINQLLDDN